MFDFDICGIASENKFSVKRLNPTRLVAVLGPGPVQPSPVPSDRGHAFLWSHFRYLKFFFGLRFCAEIKSILLGTKTFACGTSRCVPGERVRGYDGLAMALVKISVAS